MTTALLPTDSPAALAAAVARAVELLAAGEPVGLPTETVYGLAADGTDPKAAARIFDAKERPFFDPLIVHLPDRAWLARVATPPPDSPRSGLLHSLLTRFWPGPLTVLLRRRAEAVPDLVTAGSSLVAVRQSAHPVFQAVVEQFGRPLAAPSANRFGRISPTQGAHVIAELGGRIPLVLDAGPTPHGLESTIVSFVAEDEDDDERLFIVRPGPITAEMLAELCPVVPRPAAPRAAAPGQLPGHYAPRTPLVLADFRALPPTHDFRGKRLGSLRLAETPPRGEWSALPLVANEWLSAAGDLREAATQLFAALRRLDEANLDLILAELVPEQGLGVAINERLRRAAAGSGNHGSSPAEFSASAVLSQTNRKNGNDDEDQ